MTPMSRSVRRSRLLSVLAAGFFLACLPGASCDNSEDYPCPYAEILLAETEQTHITMTDAGVTLDTCKAVIVANPSLSEEDIGQPIDLPLAMILSCIDNAAPASVTVPLGDIRMLEQGAHTLDVVTTLRHREIDGDRARNCSNSDAPTPAGLLIDVEEAEGGAANYPEIFEPGFTRTLRVRPESPIELHTERSDGTCVRTIGIDFDVTFTLDASHLTSEPDRICSTT